MADYTHLNLLVIEDDPFQRAMLVRMLGTIGVTSVVQAEDGAAALAVIARQGKTIDVIVSDLDMPQMDGMAFIRHVSEAGVQASLILTSALDATLIASVETMARAYGVPLIGAIEKPVKQAELMRLLDAHNERAPNAPRRAGGLSFSIDEIGAGLGAQEFLPFYQPKVELATGRIVGTEALARWRRADGVIVPPIAFIEKLEKAGMVDQLTWVMLERAARDCRAWQEQGYHLAVSVNLSLTTLTDPTVADRVAEIVNGAGLKTSQMILEVTESAAMTDVGRALENLARLRMKGFGLAIDDFGTGYSSMSQLARIPFTELKIDQSFVKDASKRERLQVMISSSLEMARRLGLKTVAEGVETREDWDLLKRLGCDIAQGYFVARPMSSDELMKWAKEWKAPA